MFFFCFLALESSIEGNNKKEERVPVTENEEQKFL